MAHARGCFVPSPASGKITAINEKKADFGEVLKYGDVNPVSHTRESCSEENV